MKADRRNEGRLSLRTKIAYGFGALADNFMMNSWGGLVQPIYNIALKIDPVLLGVALAIPRALDALSDPVIGNISDNTRSRWGRRRPYIVVGSLLTAALLPLLWFPPQTGMMSQFLYLTVMASIYTLCYTLFVIPYCALGFELTRDYNDRTRLLAWPNYIGLIGSFTMPWLYALVLHPAFGDEIQGVRWVSVGIAAVIIVAGCMPAVFCKEPENAQEQESVRFLDAVRWTFGNRAFLILLATNLIVLCGLATVVSLNLYLNIYYVFDGDKVAAGAMVGVGGTLAAVLSYASVFMATVISTHYGKRMAMEVGLALAAVGTLSLWWTLRPEMPWLQLISTGFVGLGLQGCWMLFVSMTGDVCNEDELKTGLRREGMFSAIGGFSRKMAVAVAALGTGLLLSFSGFDAGIAESVGVSDEILWRMRAWFCFGQTGVLLAGMLLLRFYPISRERAQATQLALEARESTVPFDAESIVIK